MTTSDEVQKSPSQSIENRPEPKKTAHSPFSSPVPKWLAILATVLAALALIFSLCAIYTSQQAQQFNRQQTEHVNLMSEQLNQLQTETKTHLATITTTNKQSQSTMHAQLQEMNNSLQSAMQQQLYQKQDWLLLKARYYLELAQINAHWSDDQQATIALLQQADELLHTIPNQQLLAVRQAIAQEITQLQAIPQIDTTGLLSQLDAAQNAVEKLPIKQPVSSLKNKEDTLKNQTIPTWKQKLHESINSLEKLVVIRHGDEDVQPLLSPLYQTLLRNSIQLNLKEAQWAILQNKPAAYQLALNQALKDITRAFDNDASATQAIIKQLQTLQQVNLVTTKPTLEHSLSLLNQVIESKNGPTSNASPTTNGGKTE